MITIEKNLAKALGSTTNCIICDDYLVVDNDIFLRCSNASCLHPCGFVYSYSYLKLDISQTKHLDVIYIQVTNKMFIGISINFEKIKWENFSFSKDSFDVLQVPLNKVDFSNINDLIEKCKLYITFS